MPLTVGSRLGHYDVTALIGEGGMGQVYQATDTKLNRQVALKILPEAFATDPDRLARFQREAQVLASLNHPNIAAIHGLEESEGTRALVLELVEGPTLADRIARGAIPLDEALPIAKQIAEALEAAHEAGVIHRDLKPANIKVKDDGTVKVLDFGLAKALDTSPEGDPSQSPTLTAAATQMGVIMGTAAYMSPEQARGKTVDKRADIWSFGVVLYEMLTGRTAFEGEDVSVTLADVIRAELSWEQLPDDLPPILSTYLRRCLHKDPSQRIRDIGDVRLAMEGAFETATAHPGDSPVALVAPASKLPWLVTGVAAIAAVAVSVLHFGETVPPVDVSRFQVELPGGASDPQSGFLVLSPDGRHLALTHGNQLWVRSFDSLEARPIDGTGGARYPFWSPDSASLAFFAGGDLKKVSRTGGLVQTLPAAANGRGGAWSPNGTIVLSPIGNGTLSAVPASGGDVRAVTALPEASGSDAHRYPQFLPDGERFLYLYLTSDADVAGVYVGSLDPQTPPRRVLDGRNQAQYVASPVRSGDGYLVYRQDTVLMAQSFDASSLQSAGAAFPVADGIGMGAGNTGYSRFSTSSSGSLAYAPEDVQNTELVWFSRNGERLDLLTAADRIQGFSVSRSQERAAIVVGQIGFEIGDIWLQNLAGGAPSRFTFGPPPGWRNPVWAPDGDWVAYSTSNLAGLGHYDIRRKPTNRSGDEELLLSEATNLRIWDWAPDGSYLVYSESTTQDRDIQILPLTGDRTPVAFLETPARESHAQVSPDGGWMAYVSDEQGDPQVYVKSIPATTSLWQISVDGGTMPRWRQDGRELFYRGADGTLMAVDVGSNLANEGPAAELFEHEPTPKPLFDGVPATGSIFTFTYQPSADGQRFAVLGPAPGSESSITVVLNWSQELLRRVPVN